MSFDRRLHAYREDLADMRLKDDIAAPRYVEGAPARITAAVAPCLRRPQRDAPLDNEYLFGEPVRVFDRTDGFAWVQSTEDGYVGYVPADVLAPEGPPPTHTVSVPLAFVYAAPSIKVPVTLRLPQHAALVLAPVETVGGERFHAVDTVYGGGHILAQHVAPLGSREHDFVAVAERYLGTPYLFGGKSWFGIDCSALVQVALKATGFASPRDSDMQAACLGERLADDTVDFQRGDLVFWNGHVGILADATTLLHANGHHMRTATEPVAEALARLGAIGLPPIAIRRLGPAARALHLAG